jgi:hypothetical protein
MVGHDAISKEGARLLWARVALVSVTVAAGGRAVCLDAIDLQLNLVWIAKHNQGVAKCGGRRRRMVDTGVAESATSAGQVARGHGQRQMVKAGAELAAGSDGSPWCANVRNSSSGFHQ